MYSYLCNGARERERLFVKCGGKEEELMVSREFASF